VNLLAEPIGDAAVSLGAGRARLDDVIDHSVGIEIVARQATEVRAGDAVLLVRYRSDEQLARSSFLLEQAVEIMEAPPLRRPIILERIVNG
jgi:thymidine phosphorylase